MEISINYYRLIEKKQMGDGQIIPEGQELILIKRDDEDGLLFFETYDDDDKKLFWSKEEDVEYMQSLTEDWDEEKINQRKNYINGEFL